MKILLSLCSGIIMTGVAYSLYNAANDYGLATISLPPAIIAQDDDTSGGDETSGNPTDCNRSDLVCYSQQYSIKIIDRKKSDSEGYITLSDDSRVKFLPNTLYYIEEIYVDCVSSTKVTDVCDTKRNGSYIVSAKPVGDGTN